jgi:hypothetical protein
MVADAASLCKAMHFMAACSVRKACAGVLPADTFTGAAAAAISKADPDICRPGQILATVCKLDTGMSRMAGQFQHWRQWLRPKAAAGKGAWRTLSVAWRASQQWFGRWRPSLVHHSAGRCSHAGAAPFAAPGPAPAGCRNYMAMCAAGSKVPFCKDRTGITQLPTTKELNAQVRPAQAPSRQSRSSRAIPGPKPPAQGPSCGPPGYSARPPVPVPGHCLCEPKPARRPAPAAPLMPPTPRSCARCARPHPLNRRRAGRPPYACASPQVRAACTANPKLEGCGRCAPSWAAGKTWADCDLLSVWSDICVADASKSSPSGAGPASALLLAAGAAPAGSPCHPSLRRLQRCGRCPRASPAQRRRPSPAPCRVASVRGPRKDVRKGQQPLRLPRRRPEDGRRRRGKGGPKVVPRRAPAGAHQTLPPGLGRRAVCWLLPAPAASSSRAYTAGHPFPSPGVKKANLPNGMSMPMPMAPGGMGPGAIAGGAAGAKPAADAKPAAGTMAGAGHAGHGGM